MPWCISRALWRITCRRPSAHGNCITASCQRSFVQPARARQSLGLSYLGHEHRLRCNKASLLHNRQSRLFSEATLRQHGSAKNASAALSLAASGPLLPLSERPIQSEVSLQDLFRWHSTAAAQAEAIGATFVKEDDGPSVEDLLIELNWLLDDAVAAQRSSSNAWRPCSWRHLQSIHHSPKGVADIPDADLKVALRLGMSHLTTLWKHRTQDRVPLQYLTNCCHWRDIILAVGTGVLIPRPETELLIDFAQQNRQRPMCQYFRTALRWNPLRPQALQKSPELEAGPWLDLGTGSGAIALGLASILPKACQVAKARRNKTHYGLTNAGLWCAATGYRGVSTHVYAVDTSSEALAWAQLNVERLNVASRVLLKQGEWYSPVEHIKFAGIVSNPPYIPHSQMQHLQREVGQYEPWLALDGGVGPGLDSLTPICSGAAKMLQPGGFLALETTGGKQASDVATALRRSNTFERVEIVSDLGGHERFVKAFTMAAKP